MSVEKTYKKASSIINDCGNTFLSILKILFQSKLGTKMPKALGEKCIVLANGPSLKTSLENHPNFFKNTPLICVNTFSITNEYALLKPSYYVIIDPFFWKGDTDIIQKTVKEIEEKTTWPLHLIIPQHALKYENYRSLSKKNKNITLTPFNYTVFKGFKNIAHFFYKKNLAMPKSHNVSVAALFLGVNMGYKEIYLVGADHTWHQDLLVNNDNVLCTKVVHFYDDQSVITYKPYTIEGKKEAQKTYQFFEMWSITFLGYFLIEDYAKKQNCVIYNASAVSFIDAFKRIQL